MAQAVEQPVHGQETKLGDAVGSLAHRPLHGYRDVADTRALVAREGEHVGGRVDAEEARVEILELRVAGQAQAQRCPSWNVQLITAAAEQLAEACLRDNTTLPRAEARIADDAHPHGRRCVRCS